MDASNKQDPIGHRDGEDDPIAKLPDPPSFIPSFCLV